MKSSIVLPVQPLVVPILQEFGTASKIDYVRVDKRNDQPKDTGK